MSVEGNIETQELNELKGKIISIPQIDATLEKEGHAADAKVTGDLLRGLRTDVDNITVSDSGSVEYSNTNSGLSATNVQSAIDEVAILAKNAVSKNGGDMIEGPIKTRNADNGYSALNKNNSDTADYGTQVADHAKNGLSAFMSICALYNTFTFTDSDGNIHDVLHEGNKRFGTYTGNGNADTEYVIDTKSIGRLLLVYCTNYFSFVTPKGALAINLVEGTFRWIESTKVFYINGVLKLNTNNAAFNETDTEYNYQAI